jgi:hypothetical protein
MNKFISSPDDLVTTRDARRQGFIEYALRRNLEALPYIDKAKGLEGYLTVKTDSYSDLIHLFEIHDTLLEAAGISVKAKAHINAEDKSEVLVKFINDVVAASGEKYIDEIVYRYLLTLGDALGGKMRNTVGAIAEEKFARFFVAQLELRGIAYEVIDRQGKPKKKSERFFGAVKAVCWKNCNLPRTLLMNVNVPAVKKNVDLVLIRTYLTDFTAVTIKQNLNEQEIIAVGELKGGNDPAGADEHWKTARTSLDRLRSSFYSLELFFIGAAIEKDMANEIFTQCIQQTLSNAANLTNDNQLAALCSWLIDLETS